MASRAVRIHALEQQVRALIDQGHVHLSSAPRRKQGGEQRPQGRDQVNSSGLRIWHSRISTIWCDFAALKPITAPFPHLQRPQRCAAAASGRRKMWLADFGGQLVLRKRSFDARDQISAIGLIIRVLKLATAALVEMAARRLLVMRSRRQRAIFEQGVSRHAKGDVAAAIITPSPRAAMRTISFVHKSASRRNGLGEVVCKSFPVQPAPQPRPCSHTPALAASNAGMPRALSAAIIPDRTSPVPAVASHAGAGGCEAEAAVGRRDERGQTFKDDDRAAAVCSLKRSLRLCASNVAEEAFELALMRRDDGILSL